MSEIIKIAITILHAIVTIVTPAALVVLVAYLVKQSFEADLYMGIQSLAGALLPVVFMTFTFVFYTELFRTIGNANILVGFVPSMVWGFVVMVMLRILISRRIPLSEFILSSSFSVLILGYVGQGKDGTMLSYYYGMICGFLLYVFLFGVPSFKKSKSTQKQPVISKVTSLEHKT